MEKLYCQRAASLGLLFCLLAGTWAQTPLKIKKKKEKRRKYFRKLLAFLAHQGKRFNCRNHKETICTCMADCGERA